MRVLVQQCRSSSCRRGLHGNMCPMSLFWCWVWPWRYICNLSLAVDHAALCLSSGMYTDQSMHSTLTGGIIHQSMHSSLGSKLLAVSILSGTGADAQCGKGSIYLKECKAAIVQSPPSTYNLHEVVPVWPCQHTCCFPANDSYPGASSLCCDWPEASTSMSQLP